MVEGGGDNISFHHSDPWAAADVGAQKVTAEDVAETDSRDGGLPLNAFRALSCPL